MNTETSVRSVGSMKRRASISGSTGHHRLFKRPDHTQDRLPSAVGESGRKSAQSLSKYLCVLNKSSDVLPPLKSVAAGLSTVLRYRNVGSSMKHNPTSAHTYAWPGKRQRVPERQKYWYPWSDGLQKRSCING